MFLCHVYMRNMQTQMGSVDLAKVCEDGMFVEIHLNAKPSGASWRVTKPVL